MRFIFFFRTW